MNLFNRLKRGLSTTRSMRPWVRGHTALLVSQFHRIHRNAEHGFSDRDHLIAAARWLCRAQDATPDGGFVGRYLLNTGWTSSYPETTGYIIPTLLRLADWCSDDEYRDRARIAVAFLLDLQLENGAFPGLEVGANRSEPSPFNSAQILHGLLEWHLATGDQKSLDAAHRAADWLLTVQDADGAFRRHYYRQTPSTYSAHLTCWLAQEAQITDNQRHLAAANQHVDWVLRHVDQQTGWIDLAGFDTQQHEKRLGYTHTIAYTLWGLLYSARILNRQDALSVVLRASARIARRLELDQGLPGLVDWRWRRRGNFACLTGNAQMALIWMELFKETWDSWWLNPAFKALDEVKQAQPMHSRNPGIQGGVPGSFPIWGEYIFGGIPNWAAKFFIDALLEKEAILRAFPARQRLREPSGNDIPHRLSTATKSTVNRPRIVVLSRPASSFVTHTLPAWQKLGIQPDAVVFETRPEAPLLKKLEHYIYDHGIHRLFQRVVLKNKAVHSHAENHSCGVPTQTAPEYCRENRIKTLVVGSLDNPKSWEAIAGLQPDLLVQGGVGILRDGLCKVPSLGIVNAHMGVLPFYRGMNVAEWARLNGHRVGCSVHLILDRGIDTGDILLVREVDTRCCDCISSLRRQVDLAQQQALADVVRFVAETGLLPPAVAQQISEGRQFYRMQSDLRSELERELRESVSSRP